MSKQKTNASDIFKKLININSINKEYDIYNKKIIDPSKLKTK